MKHWFKISRASSGIYTCVVHAWHITTSWKVQYPFPKHLLQSDQIWLSFFFFFFDRKCKISIYWSFRATFFLRPNWAQGWRVTSEIRSSTSQVAIDLIKIIITKKERNLSRTFVTAVFTLLHALFYFSSRCNLGSFYWLSDVTSQLLQEHTHTTKIILLDKNSSSHPFPKKKNLKIKLNKMSKSHHSLWPH